MTKTQQEIAGAIDARRHSGSSSYACDDIAYDIARIFRDDDRDFDITAFLEASGVELATDIMRARRAAR